MTAFPDPIFAAITMLHEVRNEFADKANQSGSVIDSAACSILGIATCRVMLRLKEIMPATEYEDVHRRVHADVPLRGLSFCPPERRDGC